MNVLLTLTVNRPHGMWTTLCRDYPVGANETFENVRICQPFAGDTVFVSYPDVDGDEELISDLRTRGWSVGINSVEGADQLAPVDDH